MENIITRMVTRQENFVYFLYIFVTPGMGIITFDLFRFVMYNK